MIAVSTPEEKEMLIKEKLKTVNPYKVILFGWFVKGEKGEVMKVQLCSQPYGIPLILCFIHIYFPLKKSFYCK